MLLKILKPNGKKIKTVLHETTAAVAVFFQQEKTRDWFDENVGAMMIGWLFWLKKPNTMQTWETHGNSTMHFAGYVGLAIRG